jgi:dynein heavy chain
MNSNDVGWHPFVASWIQNREIDTERTQLTSLFSKYVPKVFEFMERNVATVVHIPEVSRVQHLTYILEGIVGNGEEFFQRAKQTGMENGAKLLEMIFVFALLWSCGGALMTDKREDYR